MDPQTDGIAYKDRVLGIPGDAITGPLHLGIRVDRAAANLPQTTQAALFTISGGRVMAWILGEVTTVIQNQANNTKLVHNPSVGTDLDLCAVLNIAADEVGTLYGITGTPADALLGAGQAVRLQDPVVLKPGTLDLNCAASNTGQVKWTVFYLPLDQGAAVVAA